MSLCHTPLGSSLPVPPHTKRETGHPLKGSTSKTSQGCGNHPTAPSSSVLPSSLLLLGAWDTAGNGLRSLSACRVLGQESHFPAAGLQYRRAVPAGPREPSRCLWVNKYESPPTVGPAGTLQCWEDACPARSVAQSCLTLQFHGHSPPGSSVHGIFQQACWSGLPFPPPGDLPGGIKPASFVCPALAGRFFTAAPPGTPVGKTDLPES